MSGSPQGLTEGHHVQEDEWTQVKPKSRYRRAPRNTPTKKKKDLASSLASPLASSNAGQSRELRPLADVQAEFESLRSKWLESAAQKRLENLVKDNWAGHRRIRKAVCLGIGTFDPDDGSWDVKRKTHMQLAAFLSLVELLSEVTDEKISCFFQEPRFVSTDKDFLRRLGHEVLETPAAFETVDEHTLLFAIHMYRPIYEAALDAKRPAMFVGTGWETWDSVGNLKESDFRCMQDMHASHDLYPFPQDGTYTTFSSTCLYWLPTNEEAAVSLTISSAIRDEEVVSDKETNNAPPSQLGEASTS